jgi:hypothetical protein
LFYNIDDVLSFFSFPSFPEFHRIVPLLQTCSTYVFIYDHACVCAYMFVFWICLPHMRGIMEPLSFWTWFTSLNMMSFNSIHLPSIHMLLFFLMAE